MRMKYFVFGLLISFFLSQNALGESGKCLDMITEVRRDIQLLNLINGLELNKRQMELIVQKAEEAEKIREEFNSRVIRENEAGFIQVLKNLRESLAQGKEASPALKRQVHEKNRIVKELKKNYEERMTEFAVDVQKGLYEHQLYILDQYVPCLILPEGSSAGQVENLKGAERKLTRIRNMPDTIFERRKEKLAQRTLEALRRRLPRGFIIEEEEEKKRILSILDEARNLADVDFALKKTELAQKLKSKYALPKPPLDISVKIERLLLASRIIPLLKNRLEHYDTNFCRCS